MLDPEFWKKTEDSDYIDYTDTDSMFLHVPFVSKYEKGTDLHVADCLDASNKIGKDVNNLILEYNRDYYFPKCGKSMDYNMTNYKTEVVAEGILLLGIKKNYCLKQIAVKDKAVSKDKQFKYTGFPNIKADTPKLAKYLLDYLKSFILEVMEENYFTYCNDYIEERKHIEELMKNIYIT